MSNLDQGCTEHSNEQNVDDPRRYASIMTNAHAQESWYGADADYVVGSPHLKHAALNSWLLGRIGELAAAVSEGGRSARILEIGGGHGMLTEHLVSLGAEVTVSEISKPSANVLGRRFLDSPQVQIIHDADGEGIFDIPGDFDLVLCVAVLHHIPDYLEYVRGLMRLVRPGGTLATFQDPDWYPRRSRTETFVDKGSYFAWRLTQGQLVEGLRTRIRRIRGQYDETLDADMTEYHVVRQGVDDRALQDLLDGGFRRADLTRYWSSQGSPFQRLGDMLGWRNTFAIEATGRRSPGDPHQ